MARKFRTCRSAQGHDLGVVGGSLDPTVPGPVVVGAVAIVLAVGLVVLVVVETRSASVKPSWAVTKLMLAKGLRPVAS